MIKVYNGYGTSAIAPRLLIDRFNKHGHTACSVNHHRIKNGISPKDTKILAFGGQSVTQFKEALGQEGLQNIQSYVQNGGHYLGICAGGYFGADHIDFTGQNDDGTLYTKNANGLGFFNGLAQGSITDIAEPFSGKTNSSAVITISTVQDQIKYKTLYWGGPEFIPDQTKQNIRILSHFKAANSRKLIMGVQCPVGDKGGRATLLGYHPEVSQANIKQWILPNEHVAKHSQALYDNIHEAPSNSYPVDSAFTFLLHQLGLKPTNKKPCTIKSARFKDI
jgi:biotin--protein ligase